MQKTILITGGAGYIGSHIAHLCAYNGYKIIVLDKLLHQQRFTVPSWMTLVQEDFANSVALDTIFRENVIHAVIHCAAFIDIQDSLKDPKIYYENNLFKTERLLESMLRHEVKKIIFSSSCAVYGVPVSIPITEDHPCNPIAPYGTTKAMVEQMLADFDRAYDCKYISLRYFNAAGAEPDYNIGEQHVPERHIIPLLLTAMHHKRPFFIFGNDYNTPDGSCIRDFLHVTDIAHAHLLALRHLEDGGSSNCFNLGMGEGVSIKQLVKMAEKLFDIPIKTVIAERRSGDPERLIADPTKIKQYLGWQPKHSHMNHILRSAYSYLLRQEQLIPIVITV